MEQRPLPEALPEPDAPEPKLEVVPAPAEVDEVYGRLYFDGDPAKLLRLP